MNHLSTEVRSELQVEPAIPDYAEAPIEEAFDWKEIVRLAREQRVLDESIPLYLVVFRSRLKMGVNTSFLLAHDASAHTAALESPALIHYFADEPDEQGRALSFCLWSDREEARRVSRDSRHTAAARMITLYASYSIERYDVYHGDRAVTFSQLS